MRRTIRDAMAAVGMKVFRPLRRDHYVARWKDPKTGRWRERSTGEALKSRAEQAAGQIALDIAEGRWGDALPWAEFCRLYEVQHIAHQSDAHAQGWHTVRQHVQRLVGPRTVQQLDAATIARWQHELLSEGLSATSVGSYATRLRGALAWAHRRKLITELPEMDIPKGRQARGREVRGEEFDRMLSAAERVRPRDYPAVRRFLRGLYLSGFRLDELRQLSWDEGSKLYLDVTGEIPFVRIAASGQKGRRDTIQPITPEFWALCDETHALERRGQVFLVPGQGCRQMGVKTLSRTISKIGKAANILVDAETGKTASAHDLRRSFCSNMDGRLTLADLQKWMRHRDVSTTLKYYHLRDAEQLAAKVWKEN